MDKEAKRKIDEIFDAVSVIAEGSYVFLCNMRHDYSRWSKSAVEYFGLPGEYMMNAGEVWAEHMGLKKKILS